MVWPGEWFYQFAESIDKAVLKIAPGLQDAPYRPYAEGFVGSYLTITGVENLIVKPALKAIKHEEWLKPMQIAGFAAMAAIPVVVGIFDPETAKATLAHPDYTAGLWGLFSGTGFRAAQSMSGYTSRRLINAAVNGAKRLVGRGGLEGKVN